MDLKGNISTEHQRPGDAARPSDTLDRDQQPESENRVSPEKLPKKNSVRDAGKS